MGRIIRNGVEYGSGGSGSNAVYLTQEAYDALPESKLTDGVEYRITDANTSSTVARNIAYDNSESGIEATSVQGAIDVMNESLTYSTEHAVKVGTWADGRTLYRKVFTFDAFGMYDLTNSLPSNLFDLFTLSDSVVFRSYDGVEFRTNPYFTASNDWWDCYTQRDRKLIIRGTQNGTMLFVIPIYYTLNE